MTEMVKVFKDKFLNGSKTHRAQVEALSSVVFEENGFFGEKIKNLLEQLDKEEDNAKDNDNR